MNQALHAAKPIFHLLAGPNGAGKTTLYRAQVSNGGIGKALEFVNADLYEQSHLQHISELQKRSEAARDWADDRREALLRAQTSFVSETVFSHPSKLALITQAQAMGFDVILYIVSLDDPQRLLVRVSQRVQEGGHNVPAQRILDRYPRTMAYLKRAVRLADLAFVYDATDSEQGAHLLVAMCEKAQTNWLVDKPPAWVESMLQVGLELTPSPHHDPHR